MRIGGSKELAVTVSIFRQQVINDVNQYRIDHHTHGSKSADEKDYIFVLFPPVPSIFVLPTFETRITDADLPVWKGGYQCGFIKLSEMDNLFWIILCGVG